MYGVNTKSDCGPGLRAPTLSTVTRVMVRHSIVLVWMPIDKLQGGIHIKV